MLQLEGLSLSLFEEFEVVLNFFGLGAYLESGLTFFAFDCSQLLLGSFVLEFKFFVGFGVFLELLFEIVFHLLEFFLVCFFEFLLVFEFFPSKFGLDTSHLYLELL